MRGGGLCRSKDADPPPPSPRVKGPKRSREQHGRVGPASVSTIHLITPDLAQGFKWLAQGFQWLAQGFKWLAQGLKWLVQGFKWLVQGF